MSRDTVQQVFDGEEYESLDRGTHDLPPARIYADYATHVNERDLPSGVETTDRI